MDRVCECSPRARRRARAGRAAGAGRRARAQGHRRRGPTSAASGSTSTRPTCRWRSASSRRSPRSAPNAGAPSTPSKDPTGICLPVGPVARLHRAVSVPARAARRHDWRSCSSTRRSGGRSTWMAGRIPTTSPSIRTSWATRSAGGKATRWSSTRRASTSAAGSTRPATSTARKLRLTERFKKTGPDTIQWTVTYDDPVFFTRPWSITRTFTRGKPGDRLLPYTCNENNKDVEHLRPQSAEPELQAHARSPATRPSRHPSRRGGRALTVPTRRGSRARPAVKARAHSTFARCAAVERARSRAPGIAPASHSPAAGGVATSWVPVTTRHGARPVTPRPAGRRHEVPRSSPGNPTTGTRAASPASARPWLGRGAGGTPA